MEKWKRITKNFLLAFILISIGFAIGKNFNQRANNSLMAGNSVSLSEVKSQTLVRVYYLHSTFRCTTCNSIEKRTKEILSSDFKSDMAEGLIQWRTDDFQENEVLAKKFDVIASCVVVALVKCDEIIYFKKLDDTWTLLDKPAAFEAYIKNNIQEVLKMRQKEV